MATIGKWRKHKFIVSPKKINGFHNLQIKGGSNLEEKKKGKKPVVKRKSAKPLEITLTVELNAFVGAKVRHDALLFVKEASKGAKGYFYVGRKKLATCKLMLTDATIKNADLIPKGTWTKAEITLTLKQCTKGNVKVSGGGDGKKKKKKKKGRNSKKASVRGSSPTTYPSGGSGSQTTTTNGTTRPKVHGAGKGQPTRNLGSTPTRSEVKTTNRTAASFISAAKQSSTQQLNQFKKVG